MRTIQGTFLSGYVTIVVSGEYPEHYFDQCTKHGIVVWNVKRIDKTTCKGNIKLKDIPTAKAISEQYNYKLHFKDKKGIPFLFKLFLRRKELVAAIIISTLFILVLSNVIWSIQISGVSQEIEQKINNQIKEYGIHPGSWVFTLDPPSVIQQNLTKDIPELLWIGVERKGTTYNLEGVEKIIVEQEEKPGPRNLVASKSAVIQKMFVKTGISHAKVNDYVNKNDLLVSGKMLMNNVEQTEDDLNENVKYVTAEGEVIGRTWYEVEVSVPLKGNFEILTGNFEERKFIRFGNLQIPYWGLKKPKYTHIFQETNENRLFFLNWELPISIGKTTFYEKVYNKIERTQEETVNLGFEQAIKELTLQLGPKIKIISKNVLQETTENGKVNLTLFITVEEDIVTTEPIIQGD